MASISGETEEDEEEEEEEEGEGEEEDLQSGSGMMGSVGVGVLETGEREGGRETSVGRTIELLLKHTYTRSKMYGKFVQAI